MISIPKPVYLGLFAVILPTYTTVSKHITSSTTQQVVLVVYRVWCTV